MRRYVLAQRGLPSDHPSRRYAKVLNSLVFDSAARGDKANVEESPRLSEESCSQHTGIVVEGPTMGHIGPDGGWGAGQGGDD